MPRLIHPKTTRSDLNKNDRNTTSCVSTIGRPVMLKKSSRCCCKKKK